MCQVTFPGCFSTACDGAELMIYLAGCVPDLVLKLCLHFLWAGALVEVKVASEDLVCALT
jgi:hypothetical protein